MSDVEEDYVVPLQDQRVFGAGVKRKRIAFVPASSAEAEPLQPVAKDSNAGDRYLSIVLGKKFSESKEDSGAIDGDTKTCAVCKQPLLPATNNVSFDAHESSIAHQVCLEHSHPPSHLDREHVGVKYLAGYGWDPDSRTGLGARQEGIRIPIKAKEKKDTAGLRERVDEDDMIQRKTVTVKKEEPVIRLNAKEVRKQDLEAKKRAERMRASFYGQDLEKYLGPGG